MPSPARLKARARLQGHNSDWKQGIRLGRRTNQTFVSIPFARLIQMLTYKAELRGIRVITHDEAYTSKYNAAVVIRLSEGEALCADLALPRPCSHSCSALQPALAPRQRRR